MRSSSFTTIRESILFIQMALFVVILRDTRPENSPQFLCNTHAFFSFEGCDEGLAACKSPGPSGALLVIDLVCSSRDFVP